MLTDPTPEPLQPLLAAVLDANELWERMKDVGDLEDRNEKLAELWTAARLYFVGATITNDSEERA